MCSTAAIITSEAAALTHMARNAAIQECQRKISYWKQRLLQLHAERDRSIALSIVKQDAKSYGKMLSVEDRNDKEIILAAIQSKIPMKYCNYVLCNDVEDRPPFIPEALMEDRDVIIALARMKQQPGLISGELFVFPDSLSADKQAMQAVCSRYPLVLKKASEELRDDRDVVLAAVKAVVPYNKAFLYASSRLQNDKEFFIAALKGSNWYTVSDLHGFLPKLSPLRKDREIAMVAIEQLENPDFSHILEELFGENLRSDREIMMMAVSSDGSVLQFASDELKADREIVKTACSRDGCALEFASLSLRADRDIVKAACAKNGCALEFASSELQNDKVIASAACASDGLALRYASGELQADQEIVKAACKSHGFALHFCAHKIRKLLISDKEFVISAIRNKGGDVLSIAPSEMRNDESVALEAIKNECSLEYVPQRMRESKSFILKALARKPGLYDNLPIEQQQDRDITLAALLGGYDPDEESFDVMPMHFPDDRDIARAALIADITYSGGNKSIEIQDRFPDLLAEREILLCIMEHAHRDTSLLDLVLASAPREFWRDKDFMLSMCSHGDDAFYYVSPELKNDRDIVQKAMEHNRSTLLHTSDDFQRQNPDLVLNYINDLCWFEGDSALDRNAVLAFTSKFENLILKEVPIALRGDRDLVRAAVSRRSEELQYATAELKDDRDFILSVVQLKGISLQFASDRLRRDEDVQIAAIANEGAAIAICLLYEDEVGEEGDFDARLTFTRSVRDKLELHDRFVKEIVCGIDIRRHSLPPAKRCQLTMLDRGNETGAALKRLIAEYLGVPLGDELKQLKSASRNLCTWGY
jgi:hypothetical protein